MVEEMEESTFSIEAAVPEVDESVKEYKIHVSSKYLELTRKKLELTRLPHELALAEEDKGEYGYGSRIQKSEIEPLIDYWLEKYSWRTEESHLNTIPQHRTAISLSPSTPPIRLHFIHISSLDPTAVPLLLIPPFPFTNLSLGPLIRAFGTPSSPQVETDKALDTVENDMDVEKDMQSLDSPRPQAFHFIIPSLPGLGFSDSLSDFETADYPLQSTAQLFDILMLRLGYQKYVVSTTSPSSSPACLVAGTRAGDKDGDAWDIPTHLALTLGREFGKSCVGVHLFDPVLRQPRVWREPWVWMRWSLAWLVGGGVFGYARRDFSSKRNLELENQSMVDKETSQHSQRKKAQPTKQRREVRIGLGKTDTMILSYALCDSPIGMLAYTLSTLHAQSPLFLSSSIYTTITPITVISTAAPDSKIKSTDQADIEIKAEVQITPPQRFSPKEIIHLTQLSWLPGPEASLRYQESALSEIEGFPSGDGQVVSNSIRKPVLGITSFHTTRSRQPAVWARLTFAPFLGNNLRVVSQERRGGGVGLLYLREKGAEEVVRAIQGFGKAVGEVFEEMKTET